MKVNLRILKRQCSYVPNVHIPINVTAAYAARAGAAVNDAIYSVDLQVRVLAASRQDVFTLIYRGARFDSCRCGRGRFDRRRWRCYRDSTRHGNGNTQACKKKLTGSRNSTVEALLGGVIRFCFKPREECRRTYYQGEVDLPKQNLSNGPSIFRMVT